MDGEVKGLFQVGIKSVTKEGGTTRSETVYWQAKQSVPNWLPWRAQDVYVIKQKSEGKSPLIQLFDRSTVVKEGIPTTDAGMEPMIPFPFMINLVKYCKFPIEFGRDPMTLLLARFKPNTVKLASQVTPNQRFIQGSPIFQFVELIQFPPFVR